MNKQLLNPQSIFQMNFRLEIIIGPMFSGKTTELIRRVSCLEAIGKNILIINHKLDSRTDNAVLTHSKQKRVAVKTSKLMDLLEQECFKKAEVIGIDEAQFFTDLYDFILTIEKTKKIVYISGLDGDYLRRPFGQILRCVPLCDSVTKLSAMDMISCDGSPAIFTKRIKKIESDKLIEIGNQDKYVAVNRKNYFR